MKNKKIMVLAILLVGLFAISAVSAADNLTDDVVSADLENYDIASVDVDIDDVSYNSTESPEVLAISEDDEVSEYGEDEILSESSPSYSKYSLSVYDTTIYSSDGGSVTVYITPVESSSYSTHTYPYYYDYSVSVYDTTVTYGESGSISMSISPSSSSTYKYYYYLRIYDSSGNQKVSTSYSSQSSSYSKTYSLSSNQLSPGTYTVKLINYYDNEVMDTATLTVRSSEISSYDSTFSDLSYTISSASSSSLINLYHDISANSYSSPMSISKTLTIDGHGHTIDAKGYNRIFSISGSNVVLKNIKFKNAYYSSGNGGAIYWSGSYGKLINCTFENNDVEGYSGGAVYWYGSNANITNCKFTNNSAYYGGALYLSGSSSKISNCEFTSNSADYQGGAIYTTSSSTIENSNFKTNKAEYGGAIAVGNSYTVNLDKCNFNNNVADYGSAIKWYSSMGTVTNCTFNGAKTNSHKYMYISSQKYPYFYITAEDITLGEKLNLTIDWSGDLQGNMTIDIFSERLNKTAYSKVEQLNGLTNSINLLIPNLKTSDYTLNVIYSGDNIYNARTITDEFTVIGKPSNITFTVQNITWGTPIVLNPKVTAGATGFIEIYVDDEYVDKFAVGSKYNLMNVGGPYSDIELIYLGDDNYRSSSDTQRTYVERLDSSLTLPEKFVSGYSTIALVFNEDVTGYVEVEFAGYSYSGYLEDGIFEFETRYKVSAGSQYLSIHYFGDGKYNPLYESQNVDVEIQVPTLQLDIANVKYGSNVLVTPYIKGASGTYSIYIDGEYKTRISASNYYTIYSPSLGKYDVRVVYSGDSYYASVENTTAFRVYECYPIEIENTKIIHNTNKYLKATFYDEYGDYLSNKNVIFNVNGTDYYRLTDENGTAILDKSFAIGNYPLVVINPIVNEKKYTALIVFTSIRAENMTVYYNSGYDFNATFLDANANNLTNTIVIFDVNGTLYHAATNGYGEAKLSVPLPVGTYKITSTNEVTGEKTTNKLTVITNIISEDMSRAYNSSIDYKATFYDVGGSYLSNQTVTFEVAGREYKVQTDLKGQAILNVGLAKGLYNITSINPVTNQKSVNKLTILERIINNNDVVVFGNEATYYRVKVINNNAVVCGAGETVTFTINGKRSEIKTASDGYASLKITESSGIYTVTASYKGYTVENEVIVLENVASVLTLTAANINYGQKETIGLTVGSNYLYGNVTILVNGSNGYERLFNQKASQSISKELSDLNASTYQVTALYTDFDNLYFSKATKSFTVSKSNPDVIVTCEGDEYGKNSTITVNIQKASGNVVIKVGDKTYAESVIKNGVVIKKISDLRPGNYSVSVTYEGNNNFNKATKTSSLEVLRGSVGFYTTAAKVTYGQDVVAKVYSSYPGKVTLKIGDITKTVDVTAGNEVSANFGKLNAGKYTLSANIAPTDKNYESVSDAIGVEVAKAGVSLAIKAENIELGQATQIAVTISNGLNGNIKLQLDGNEYVQASSGSKVTFNIANLKLGKYTPKAIFDGNANYNAASNTATFEVQKIKNMNTIIANSVSNLDYAFACDLPQDASGTVTVSINGHDYTANVVNGNVNVQLPKLADGDYPYTIKYSGDSKYAGFTSSNTLKVSKTTIKSGDARIIYGNGYDYKTTFINADGTPLSNSAVSFIVNGKEFKTTTDSNGVAKLNVGLGDGVYKIISVNSKTGETSTNTLTIVGGTTATILTAAKVTAVYNNGKKLTVSLKDVLDRPITGVPISINLKGNIKVVLTDSKGQATLGVSTLLPGTYKAQVSFTGDAKFTASSVYATVKVNKATPKLTASKKTFKADLKVKKYTVTLKTNKKKALKKAKVTIKVNGKTYKATTNAKGKATFNISKLAKKGKFTAVVKYKGNKYYKAISKKVVITLN